MDLIFAVDDMAISANLHADGQVAFPGTELCLAVGSIYPESLAMEPLVEIQVYEDIVDVATGAPSCMD